MVYESDFYTSRRPYTRPSPSVTSYSVTRREVPWHKVPNVPRPSQDGVKLPGLGKGQTFHRAIPGVAHKRLVFVPAGAAVHSVRSRPSVLIGEMDRIYHRVRPNLAYQPTEDYLNSRSIVSFDDETRSIRAQTADLLKKIHTTVPRAQRPLPLPGDFVELVEAPADWYDWYDWFPEDLGQTRLRLKLVSLKRDLSELGTGAYYSHSELPLSDRITSDVYIDRLLSGTRNVAKDINIMSHYEEPARHCNYIGQGHLACVTFAGGRPISRRRNLAGDEHHVRNDINVLSHYGRLRAAAAAAATPPTEPAYEPPLHRPPTKSAVTGSWKSNAPRTPKDSARLTAGQEFDAAQERKQGRREAIEAAAQREVDEERRRKNDIGRQDGLAKQALLERDRELERKAREEEEEALRRQEEELREAERLAKEEEERLLREEEELLAAEQQRILEEEEARKEEEKKAKKAKKEAEKKAKEEEEARRIKAEAEKKAEEERLAKEEEERKAQEEAELKRKEEEERIAREEAEQKRREEEERIAREQERLAIEEAEKVAREEAERIAAEEAAAAALAEQEVAASPEPAQVAAEVVTEEVLEPETDGAEETEAAPLVTEPEPEQDTEVQDHDQVAETEAEADEQVQSDEAEE